MHNAYCSHEPPPEHYDTSELAEFTNRPSPGFLHPIAGPRYSAIIRTRKVKGKEERLAIPEYQPVSCYTQEGMLLRGFTSNCPRFPIPAKPQPEPPLRFTAIRREPPGHPPQLVSQGKDSHAVYNRRWTQRFLHLPRKTRRLR